MAAKHRLRPRQDCLVVGSDAAPNALKKILISAREAAECLGISERTLWSETKAGHIPSVRLNRRVLYRPDSLEEFAARLERSSAWDGYDIALN
jgi:excisionase family DNA binding protein